MNVKKIAALSLVALAVGFSSAKADPWRHDHRWERPRVAVRFYAPAPRVFVRHAPVVVEGYYNAPQYVPQYPENNCRNNNYSQPYYNNGYNQPGNGYNNGYYGYYNNQYNSYNQGYYNR